MEGECFAQYAKLCKKVSSGAQFAITQLGYDVVKFQELLLMQKKMGISRPTLGSLYYLTPRIARIMNSTRIPGAVVTDRLSRIVEKEWTTPQEGRKAAIERSARLGCILKGLGYRGIHIGGIQRNFDTVGKILDRMDELQDDWKHFITDFDFPQPKGFYYFSKNPVSGLSDGTPNLVKQPPPPTRKNLFNLMQDAHNLLFSFDSPLAGLLEKFCGWADKSPFGKFGVSVTEDFTKKIFLECKKCGDCGIIHVAFLCPESQCPKHIRNGACGGSHNGKCEVYPDRRCIWYRAFNRLATAGTTHEMTKGCVPPRMWELNNTSSWINFFLKRDHQSAATEITRFCSAVSCRLDIETADPCKLP